MTLAAAVRRRLVMRQLGPHLPPGGHVVDLGCGVGWLAVDLLEAGFRVTALDADPSMVDGLVRLRRQLPREVAARLELVRGRVEDVTDLLPAAGTDAVCCHAVLPFVADHRAVLADVVRLVRPGGVVSVVAKNAAALPLRAALRGGFADALALAGGAHERDDRGRVLRAHDRDDVVSALVDAGVSVVAWHGLQVVTSHRDDPAAADLVAAAVDLEERLGDRDPSRLVARQFHLVGTRLPGVASDG